MAAQVSVTIRTAAKNGSASKFVSRHSIGLGLRVRFKLLPLGSKSPWFASSPLGVGLGSKRSLRVEGLGSGIWGLNFGGSRVWDSVVRAFLSLEGLVPVIDESCHASLSARINDKITIQVEKIDRCVLAVLHRPCPKVLLPGFRF